jgi:hypothetical protein
MKSIPLRQWEAAAYAAGDCTCLWSITATSETIHNADPACPVHGETK